MITRLTVSISLRAEGDPPCAVAVQAPEFDSFVECKGLVAGTANVASAFLRGAAFPSIGMSGGAAVVGFLGVGLSLVLLILALRHLGTARTGAYFSFAPFIGALVAIALLHDPLSVKLILSGALMGFGLWMHLAERHEHEHEHDVLEHEHSHTPDGHHQRHTSPRSPQGPCISADAFPPSLRPRWPR